MVEETCTQFDTSECCPEPEIKHNCNVEYSSSTVVDGKVVRVTKTGYGTGETKEEACEAATLDAQEQAAELWRLKNLILNYISGFGDDNFKFVSPKVGNPNKQRWEGIIEKKPSQYPITVCIPHLETIEPLWIAVQLIRKQTVRPYIIIIDTGSGRKTCELLERMRAEDLEISYIRSNSYRHPSQPVPAAMDLAHSLCATDYILHTHSDVFFMRDDLIEDLLRICSEKCPAIGYEMSPRDWITNEWEDMLGHTLAILHLPTIEKTGATWSIERVFRSDKSLIESYAKLGGWPDTETGWNRIIKSYGIRPFFIGHDVNYRRTTDTNIDHVRSYPGSRMYALDYFKTAEGWMLSAMKEALNRLGLVN